MAQGDKCGNCERCLQERWSKRFEEWAEERSTLKAQLAESQGEARMTEAVVTRTTVSTLMSDRSAGEAQRTVYVPETESAAVALERAVEYGVVKVGRESPEKCRKTWPGYDVYAIKLTARKVSK